MQTLAAGIGFVDLMFRRHAGIIATGVLHGASGVALVDPGPTSTLPTLTATLAAAGIETADITDILLTHIHLDHAGATGTLLRAQPRIRVHVHERGAGHLADPAKLVASATRLYGDAMDRLWGEILPVPASSLIVLKGGESIEIAGRRLAVAATPGHASHHVCYCSHDTGIAFVGDTAGVRIGPSAVVVPPTPPPDIDLERWHDSIAAIGRWNPTALLISHYGVVSSPSTHLAALGEQIDFVGRLSRQSLALDGDETAKAAWFVEELRRDLRRQIGGADPSAYELAGRFELNWQGLARYWKKKSEAGNSELRSQN
jgi:glyoxylase-like metal-dependent hydrolase (beta-lactamase superfamily II)